MSAVISPDPSLNVSEEISDFFSFLLKDDRPSIPSLSIPQLIAAEARQGLSAEVLSSSIIARFKEIGIPNGPLAEGTPNVMEALIKVICEEIVDALQNDARIDIAVDGGIPVTASGGNSGGPVVAQGATDSPQKGSGVIR